MPIKVAIVDDDEGIRSSLSALIKRAPGFKLVGEFANGETALKEIPKLLPDVVLMDINLPGMKGYECVRQLKAAHPTVQFLILTVYEDSESLFNSLRAGASGYLLKRTAEARLLEAMVGAGARDGMTRENAPCVDGMPLQASLDIIEEIRSAALGTAPTVETVQTST